MYTYLYTELTFVFYVYTYTSVAKSFVYSESMIRNVLCLSKGSLFTDSNS